MTFDQAYELFEPCWRALTYSPDGQFEPWRDDQDDAHVRTTMFTCKAVIAAEC